jgi:ArsR family transcriptional regulator, lead/cadmium/zinc/bismuth-responsive transcriptional repressor
MSQVIVSPIAVSEHRVLPTGAERVREGKSLLRDDDLYLRVSEIFRALADSSRAKIVDALLHQELCTSDLAPIVGISESAVSQHLRMLKLLRVVKSHRHGNRVFYALEDEHVRSLLLLTVDHLQHQRTAE